ncbi:enoyl-CoA hydratase [Corynebacterium yudongzhengii]|uniref:enoyl-CoA hydratase n=1 Tax=Corynebacterium yudongzhengii TaxID=2080740 RepID=UPI001F1F20E7|nr:enoyl-CoA hydratase [Corynebacterium yudongzhengii]
MDDHIAVITLDRHSRRNALNHELCRTIRRQVSEALEAGARALVLTGAGTAFCAGADLDLGPESEGLYDEITATLACLQNAPVPVVAAVNGPAVGAGTLLAMACDLRIVSERAWFKIPAVDVAIALDGVSVRAAERLFGGARARALLLASETVSAAEALECGFALRSGERDDACALARRLADKAPLTLRHLKAEFTHDGYAPYTEAERERFRQAAANSEDLVEAAKARAEKRAPVFRGL